MRKVALLLLGLVLCAWFIPAPQPSEAQLIPWDDWSDFWWNVQTESVGDPVATVEPIIGQHQFKFKFWNGGVVQGDSNIPLRYYLKITNIDGEGWNAYVNPTFLPLGQNKMGNATVTVNAGSKPSYIANITCQVEMHVKMTSFIKYGNITFQVRAEPYRWLGVSIENPTFKGKQETTYQLPINITNNGNYEDTYMISIPYAPSGWLYSVSEYQVHLFPEETATVYFTFHIPHERIYIQYESYIMLVKVQSTNEAGYAITKPVVVSLSGFHMTMGQTAAAAAALPTVFLLVIIGSLLAYTSNPCHQLPKPWKDPQEKKRLARMDRSAARHEKKLLREEWQSAYYFCQGERAWRQRGRSLLVERNRKQAALQAKIISAWRDSWMAPRKEWREQQQKIEEEYHRDKQRLINKWHKINRTVKQANKELGTDLPPPPKPSLPPVPEIPKPGELPKPRIPQYRVNLKRMVLVEPDARLVAKILAPLHRASQVGKMEREKVRQLGVTRRKKLRLAMQSLENTMDATLKRTQRHIEFECKKRQQQKKLLERRYKMKSEPRQRDRERRLRREALRQQFKQQDTKRR